MTADSRIACLLASPLFLRPVRPSVTVLFKKERRGKKKRWKGLLPVNRASWNIVLHVTGDLSNWGVVWNPASHLRFHHSSVPLSYLLGMQKWLERSSWVSEVKWQSATASHGKKQTTKKDKMSLFILFLSWLLCAQLWYLFLFVAPLIKNTELPPSLGPIPKKRLFFNGKHILLFHPLQKP